MALSKGLYILILNDGYAYNMLCRKMWKKIAKFLIQDSVL